jgi:hypothetical protein
MYDKVRGSFLSRAELESRLSSTGIPIAPLIYTGVISSTNQLESLVTGPSQYNEDKREGIVIRVYSPSKDVDSELSASVSGGARRSAEEEEDVEHKEVLSFRAKIVRADFIEGTERWNRSNTLLTNSLAPSPFSH